MAKKKEGKTEGKGKRKAKGKGKRKAGAKGKAKAEAKGKRKAGAKGKRKAGAKGKAKAEGKGKGKGKRKAEAKGKRKDEAKKKGKGKDKAKVESEGEDKSEVAQAVPKFAQRRWKQVANKLGLERHIVAASEWDGQGDPPLLTGFTFVRHVESDARDLKCAGTAVTMTQGVIVKREDGKLFLTGRGVAQKFLGLQVPWKSRANTGQRFLTALEREDLGQPQAQSTVAESGG
jgi:hypothetical protein